MRALILHETDNEDGETMILGVYSSPEKALEKMRDFYGDYEEIEAIELEEGGVSFVRRIIAKGAYHQNCNLTLTLMDFYMDE